MAGMPIGFRVDNAEVLELFARAPTAVKRRLTQLVEGGAIDVQREMRQQAPVAVTGYLRRSVQYRFSPGLIQAIIEPQAKYAAAIEEGRGPHHVSVAEGTPLRDWAEFRGLDPYAVQSSIEKKGTKANPFIKRTYNIMRPRVERDIERGLLKLVQEMEGSGSV